VGLKWRNNRLNSAQGRNARLSITIPAIISVVLNRPCNISPRQPKPSFSRVSRYTKPKYRTYNDTLTGAYSLTIDRWPWTRKSVTIARDTRVCAYMRTYRYKDQLCARRCVQGNACTFRTCLPCIVPLGKLLSPLHRGSSLPDRLRACSLTRVFTFLYYAVIRQNQQLLSMARIFHGDGHIACYFPRTRNTTALLFASRWFSAKLIRQLLLVWQIIERSSFFVRKSATGVGRDGRDNSLLLFRKKSRRKSYIRDIGKKEIAHVYKTSKYRVTISLGRETGPISLTCRIEDLMSLRGHSRRNYFKLHGLLGSVDEEKQGGSKRVTRRDSIQTRGGRLPTLA